MKAAIQYLEGTTQCVIRTEDGGIATCHHNGAHMLTEYYHERSQEREPNWDELAKHKMSIKDWESKQEIDTEIIMDALNWLVMPQPKFEISEHYLFETPAIGLKVCSKCDAEKPKEAFFKDLRNKDNLTSECKACRIVIMKTYVDKKREQNKNNNN